MFTDFFVRFLCSVLTTAQNKLWQMKDVNRASERARANRPWLPHERANATDQKAT